MVNPSNRIPCFPGTISGISSGKPFRESYMPGTLSGNPFPETLSGNPFQESNMLKGCPERGVAEAFRWGGGRCVEYQKEKCRRAVILWACRELCKSKWERRVCEVWVEQITSATHQNKTWTKIAIRTSSQIYSPQVFDRECSYSVYMGFLKR